MYQDPMSFEDDELYQDYVKIVQDIKDGTIEEGVQILFHLVDAAAEASHERCEEIARTAVPADDSESARNAADLIADTIRKDLEPETLCDSFRTPLDGVHPSRNIEQEHIDAAVQARIVEEGAIAANLLADAAVGCGRTGCKHWSGEACRIEGEVCVPKDG